MTVIRWKQILALSGFGLLCCAAMAQPAPVMSTVPASGSATSGSAVSSQSWAGQVFDSILGRKQRVYLDIDQARVKKSVLALPSVVYQGATGTPSQLALGMQLFQVIENNLKASFLFEFIKPKAFIEDVSRVGLEPIEKTPNGFRFGNWQSIGADFLIRCGYTVDEDDKVKLQAYLYYVPHRKQVFYKIYTASRDQLRRIGHNFSNDVVRYLTGHKGWFEARLVVTKAMRRGGPKEVWVMDWDAHRQKKITQQGLAISPTWSPAGDVVAYTAFSMHRRGRKQLGRNVDLYAYNLKTRKKAVLSYAKGINSGAAFFPNAAMGLLFTRTSPGARSADIYRMSSDGKNLRPLTRGPFGAMNVEPAVSPDSKWIAFSSDRGGRPMIYIMPADGELAGRPVVTTPPSSGSQSAGSQMAAVRLRGASRGHARAITFAGVYNSSPSWSPDGKKIAFAGLDKARGVFDIFVVGRDGRGLKRLTSAKRQSGRWANNEAPVFTPSGQHIVFVSDRSGNKQLYVTDVNGHEAYRITHDTAQYEKPKFSFP